MNRSLLILLLLIVPIITDAHSDKIITRGINQDFNKTYKAVVKLKDNRNDIVVLQIVDTSFNSIDEVPIIVLYVVSLIWTDWFKN